MFSYANLLLPLSGCRKGKILGKIIFVNAEGDASTALPGSKAEHLWFKKMPEEHCDLDLTGRYICLPTLKTFKQGFFACFQMSRSHARCEFIPLLLSTLMVPFPW